MKKMSILNATTLFLVVMLLSASLFQCKKEGDLVKGLNRSFTGISDSTLYAAFYESNPISTADATPDVNDVMKFRGVQTIVHEYCGTSNCHNGPISPKLTTYGEIMKYVTAGNPEGSKIWEFLTTNDFNKAMPPVNSNHEMNATDKTLLYNWIKNGAKEKPDLADFRPATLALINSGCGSVNCHNQSTATGAWARKGWINGLVASDTTNYVLTKNDGSKTNYCLLTNKDRLNRVWTAYKDSVKKFYADTIANLSFKPYMTFSTRGPLNTYDDVLMDILYPKSIRSTTVKNNWMNSNDCFIREVDSTLIYSNVYTGAATSVNGKMAYGDGGLKPSEVALIKAWYFADPNIPDYWKYGRTNAGIFKYKKISGGVITKK